MKKEKVSLKKAYSKKGKICKKKMSLTVSLKRALSNNIIRDRHGLEQTKRTGRQASVSPLLWTHGSLSR